MRLRDTFATLLLALALAFGALALLSGCTPEQHESAAVTLQAYADRMETANRALKSDLANAITGAISALPVPAAPAVKPVQVGAEWIAGALATILAGLAEWQRRKAAAAKKERNSAFDRLPTEARKEAIMEAQGIVFSKDKAP